MPEAGVLDLVGLEVRLDREREWRGRKFSLGFLVVVRRFWV